MYTHTLYERRTESPKSKILYNANSSYKSEICFFSPLQKGTYKMDNYPLFSYQKDPV